jgi:hypothetical protein
MKRILIVGTIVLLIAVMVGTGVAQDNVMQLFASGEPAAQVIRCILFGLLIGLLLTSPPRSVYFRTVLGAGSIVLVVGSAAMLAGNGMLLLDALIFIEAAIIFAVDAIESPTTDHATEKKVTSGTPRRTKKVVA